MSSRPAVPAGAVPSGETRGQIPSESTFSRAFADFAVSALPARVREALVKTTHAERLVGHISRDSTAIEVRERPAKATQPAPAAPRGKRGRLRKGEAAPRCTAGAASCRR
jgi:hypothetical protein